MVCAVPNKPEDSSLGAHWSYHYWADSLYFPHLPPLLCIDSPVQPSSGIGPYDGIDGDIGDPDCLMFAMDSIGREILEEEKKKQDSSYFPLQQIYGLLEANKSCK